MKKQDTLIWNCVEHRLRDGMFEWRYEGFKAIVRGDGTVVHVTGVNKREVDGGKLRWYVVSHDGGFDCDGDELFLRGVEELIGERLEYMMDDMVSDETNFDVVG